ncbi:MAG: threonine synthase [Frankiaceae bacterium]|jgi:threonine synthase|nr:threonine synthase [Frankiaceae bacterium]
MSPKGLAFAMTSLLDQTGRHGATTSSFGAAINLTCRECGATYDLGPGNACEQCFGPLEIGYDESLLATVTRESIEAGPRTMWRYGELLPATPLVDLQVGCTRLHRADNLARELGMKTLWVKDDSGNPTHSFKDRVVAVAASAAKALGFSVLSCASTGNLANAVAAAAARAGLRSVVFIPHDLEAGKVVTTAVYGGTLVAVDGNYDDVNRLCAEVAGEQPWAFVNVNVRPFYAEGSKTLGYEVAEQLGWRLPDQVVVPIASGALLTKVDKAWREFSRLGLVEAAPYKVFGAQATGCSPVSAAFAAGHDVVQPVRPSTIAKSLAIGNPADGPYALDVVRRTGGAIADVSDAEIVEGIQLLARTEGVFAETAGGVTVATLRKLLADGALDPAAETVILNTGDGLKTLDAVAPVARPTATIRPSLEAFREAGLA